MTRRFGRASKGERVVDSVPQNYGTNITLLGALTPQGIEAVMSIEGATDGQVFRAYVDRVLGPTLAPGDVVMMDNLSAHKSAAVSALIEARGARLIYLSPYSPDYSPIELCWSKRKHGFAPR